MLLSLSLAALAVGPVSTSTPQDRAPVAVVLGSAQDAGLPQANDRCPRCERARRNPRHRRFAASLALIDPETEQVFLIDATPDLPRQLDLLVADETLPLAPGRSPLAGVLLTHAHVGHYAGLIHFGREIMGSKGLPVHATEKMGRFLKDNGPWSQLVELGQIELRSIRPGQPFRLSPNLEVTPIAVPHRDEFSDTVGFIVRGPTSSLLWLPDIDKWEKWDRKLEDVLATVDQAFLDGTFYSGAELPDRDLSQIPHPTVKETVERLGAAPDEARGRVWFIHLNHSNPLLGPGAGLRRKLERQGFGVAREGQRIPL